MTRCRVSPYKNYTGCFVTCGTYFGSCTPKNNGKKSYKCLSIFVYEIQWILCFDYFCKKCSKWPACIWRQVIHLITFSIVPRICRKPCSILFRSISAFSIDVACTIDFKCPHKRKSNGFKSGERAGHAIGPPRPIYLQSVDLKIAWPLG